MFDTRYEKKEFLMVVADTLSQPYQQLCYDVVNDSRFQRTPGGATHHHTFEGGLLIHTAEVVSGVDMLSQGLNDIERAEVITAAFWHDFAKIYEYRIDQPGTDFNAQPVIVKLPYRNLIGHVVGSVIEFTKAAEKRGLPKDAIERIQHIMLSHHGRLEWRSPVEPQTPGAFILHAADMLSARKS